jgi:hypothetical protein
MAQLLFSLCRQPRNIQSSARPRNSTALLDSLQSIPGVRGTAVSSGIPFGVGIRPIIETVPPGEAVHENDCMLQGKAGSAWCRLQRTVYEFRPDLVPASQISDTGSTKMNNP